MIRKCSHALTFKWRANRWWSQAARAVALAAAVAVAVPSAEARNIPDRNPYVLERDADGWTIVTPDSFHRKIYVSTSGSNSNSGLSEQSPKRTVKAGADLVRPGSSDWLLLKRGDVFDNDEFGRLGDGSPLGTGGDPDHPQLVGAYGSGDRPVVRFPLRVWKGPIHNIVLRDLVFDQGGGVDFLDYASTNVYFENILFHNQDASRVQAPVDGMTFYRCTFLDAHRTQPSNGASNWLNAHENREMALYITGTNNFLMEQCVSDHNGWREGYDPTAQNGSAPQPPSQYSHNIYFGPNNLNLTVRENISTRGASMGIKLVSPGLIEGNVFVGNSIASHINDGGQNDPPETDSGGDILTLRDNVVMHPSNKNAHQIGARGWGLVFKEDDAAHGGEIVRNIEAHGSAPQSSALSNQPAATNGAAVFADNVVYNYNNAPNLDPDPNTSYPDPSRDIISYNVSVGGQASLDDFYQNIRSLSRDNWNPDYLARNIVNYMQEGFGISEGGSSPVSVTGVSATPASVSVQEAATVQLTATVSPSNATNQNVSWSSNQTSIATVNENGLVTGVSAGTAIVTVVTVDGNHMDTVTVTVTELGSSGGGIAVGADVTASAYQDDSNGYHPPELLVDGDTSDAARWSANGFSQSAVIDLGDQYDLSAFRLYPYQNRAYQYTIEASADGSAFSTVVNRSSNTEAGAVLTDLASATGRFIRLTVTGASGYSGSWVSIIELQIDGSLSSQQPPAELLSFNDFSGPALIDMPSTYTLGSGATDVWVARAGDCSQCSQILTDGGDEYADSGSGTTNGTIQVVPWPGSGTLDVQFDYRGAPTVHVAGGNAGDTIGKWNNANTLTAIDSASMTSSSSWAAGSITTTLSGSYDYLVIRFASGGDLDNVSAVMVD